MRCRFYFFLIALCLLNACVRYVSPRSEIDSSDKEKTSALLGAQEFQAFEELQKQRVAQLVAARAPLITNHSEDTYRLGGGDILEFDVFGLPNLHTEIEVSPSGTAQFPLLTGEVEVGNKSLFQVKRDLQARLSRFVRNPQIKLTVKEFQGHKVAVTGAVAKPGMYALKRGAPLLSEMISEAGGRNDKAGNRIILAAAPISGGVADPNAAGIEVDFEDLIGNSGARPLMVPIISGDTIIVPEAGTFEVEGEVKTPGSYKITSRKTVMGAIAAAGGFGFAAKVREVEVIRDIGGGKKAYVALNLEDIALKGQDDVRVRDGDLIRVPTESGRHIERQIVETLNSIFRGVGVQGRVN